MEDEGGCSIFVEDSDPFPQGGAKAHGLQNQVYPGEADSIIGVEKVQAYKVTRQLMLMKESGC